MASVTDATLGVKGSLRFLYIRAKEVFSLIFVAAAVAAECKHAIGFSMNPFGATSLSL